MRTASRRPRTLLPAFALLAGLLLLAGCEAADTADDTADPADAADPTDATDRVDRVRLAGGDFGHPTPFGWNRGPGRMKASLAFDTLAWRDGDGEMIPWLAQDWEADDDGATWRFDLREDVTWHDGTPLSARDVAFSYRYAIGDTGATVPTQTVGALPGLADLIEEVEATGDHEVEVRLSQPHAAFLEWVAGEVLIIPEHVWADVDAPERYRDEDATIGTGPYRVVEADPASGAYLFEANDDFFLGPPVVEEVAFVPAPDDEVLALERGELDVATVDAGAPEAQLEAAAEPEHIERREAPGEWNKALHVNPEAGAPFDDANARRALVRAIDEQDLVARVYDGRAQVGSTGGLAPDHPQGAEGLPALGRDLDAMEEALEDAGLARRDETVVDADGEPVAVELLASARDDQRVVELLVSQLREAGFAAEAQVRDASAADELAREGDYQVALLGYGDLARDADLLRLRYSSEVPGEAFNRAAGFADDRVDELAAAQLRATDPDERDALLVDLQQRLAELVPVRSLVVPDQIALVDTEVLDGWEHTPGCMPCGVHRNKLLLVTGDLEAPASAP